MQRVYQSEHIIDATLVQNILLNQGIKCWIKNEYLAGGAGDLPLNECWPEVWIEDDRDDARAAELIAAYRTRPAGKEWTCPDCGEQLEPQFESCWHCGVGKPG